MFFSTAAMNNPGQNAASAVDLHRKMRAASSAALGGNSKLLKIKLYSFVKENEHSRMGMYSEIVTKSRRINRLMAHFLRLLAASNSKTKR